MSQNAFTGGIDPGGLWAQNDIRILICYILASVNAPLTEEDLLRVIQGRGLANYFEAADALSALVRLGHVLRGEEGYTVSDTGREIAGGLDTELPLSVRDKALEAAMRLLAEARSKRENRVEIQEDGKGCRVACRVLGGEGVELMAVSLYVPDRAQAQLVREKFYENPDRVYSLLLAVLTGDEGYTG